MLTSHQSGRCGRTDGARHTGQSMSAHEAGRDGAGLGADHQSLAPEPHCLTVGSSAVQAAAHLERRLAEPAADTVAPDRACRPALTRNGVSQPPACRLPCPEIFPTHQPQPTPHQVPPHRFQWAESLPATWPQRAQLSQGRVHGTEWAGPSITKHSAPEGPGRGCQRPRLGIEGLDR